MYESTLHSFDHNVRDVERLIDFDRDVVDIMIMSLRDLKATVPAQFHSLSTRIDRVAKVMADIRSNDSLKGKYQVVCNQAVVLLVSHFTSALGELFRSAVAVALDREGNDDLLNEELKLSFRELKERGWDIKRSAGELLIAKKDLTFQDMHSTVRAFHTYAGVEITKDQRVNNIILGQAARHVIVHASARVTDRMLRQVSKAAPRTIKPVLALDEAIAFDKDEVLSLKNEMLDFVSHLVLNLQARQ